MSFEWFPTSNSTFSMERKNYFLCPSKVNGYCYAAFYCLQLLQHFKMNTQEPILVIS